MRRIPTGLLALAAALAGCAPKEAPPMAFPPPLVVVTTVAAADTPVYLDEMGRCAALEKVDLKPQVAGRIAKVHVADGADVKKDDLLFTIDPRPFQAQLAAAEAGLAQASAALDLAKTDFTRAAALLEKKALSKQDYDASKGAVDVSDARVRQNQAAVETAKLNLEYCTLRSPIDGRVGRRLVDAGNIVEANTTPLLVIQRLDPIYAEFTVTENNLGAVQKHLAAGALKAEVRLPDEPDSPRVGELTFIDNAVQDGTGTVKLRATLANADRRLWPGQFIRVRLILATMKGALLIPAEATQMSPTGPFVYVIKDDSTAELRPVTLGQVHENRVVVEKGLLVGERIVLRGHLRIMPGAKVQTEEPKTAAGESAKP